MKKLILICMSVLFFFSFSLKADEKTPSFAIYLVKEPNEKIENAILESIPLITDKDIISYEWKDHIITLTEEGAKKIPDKWGDEFIIVANGQRCYQGMFWSSLLSSIYSKPIINVFRKTNVIKIKRAYPSEKYARGTDPRSDERIKNALEALGKLKNSEQSTPLDSGSRCILTGLAYARSSQHLAF